MEPVTKHVAKSYRFDHFSDVDRRAEIKRLHLQATVLIDREVAFLRELGVGAGQRVLDLGCGPGFIAGAIAELVAPGETVGVDASAELLGIAQAVVAPEHANLRFSSGNAYGTALPDATFDFIYNRLLYQHLSDPLAALREAKRLLRPGGRVCVIDVDDAWLTLEPRSEAFDALVALAATAQVKNGGDRHIARRLPRLMSETGFSKVDFRVVAATSLELGLQRFLDITTRFKAQQIGTPEAGALLSQIDQDVRRHGPEKVFGAVGVFCVVGTR